MEDYLRAYGSGVQITFVVRYTVARWLEGVMRSAGSHIKMVLLIADLHYLRGEREAALSCDNERAIAANKEKAVELEVIGSAAVTITHSTVERDILRLAAPGSIVEVVPWIVRPVATYPGFAERSGMLFVGSFDHLPNIDAMVYFVVHVWPRVRARLPGIELRIVGSRMGPAVRALAQDDVRVLGVC